MSYICSIKLKTVINMETKKFAEENAGKFFRFRNETVKVVGYSKENRAGVLVSGYSDGWDSQYSGVPITFVCRSRGEKLWWVAIYQLQPITDEDFATEKAGKQFEYVSGEYYDYWGTEFVTLCGYSSDSYEDMRLIIDRQRKGWSSKMFAPTDKVLKQGVYDSYWYVSQTDLEEVL
jgi:hypothetical protein